MAGIKPSNDSNSRKSNCPLPPPRAVSGGMKVSRPEVGSVGIARLAPQLVSPLFFHVRSRPLPQSLVLLGSVLCVDSAERGASEGREDGVEGAGVTDGVLATCEASLDWIHCWITV